MVARRRVRQTGSTGMIQHRGSSVAALKRATCPADSSWSG